MTVSDVENRTFNLENVGKDILEASQKLDGVINKTELIYSDFLAANAVIKFT